QDFTLQTLPVKEERPNAYTQDLLLIKDVVAQIIYNPLTLDHKDTQITLKPELILSFLNVSTSSYELSQLDHSGFMYYQTPDKRVAVSLNYPVFKNYAQTTIAPKVFTSPRAKVKATKDGKVESLEVTKQGQDLDLEKFTYDFSQALFKFKDTVTIPTKQFSFDGDAKSLGIKERLARGDSTYRGSALSREHNLLLAAERADGVLVPPNGIYSFNEAVGDISAETGYDSAFIINNGQTVLGSGGGVCQTSTTLFRAVLNSGLPVVSRNAHAYRVRYYELDSAVGFDAAIFQPTLDFKFKNDTKDYILVTAFHDTESKTLHFDIYGTPDGRTVQITEPVQTNVTAPPEPVYKDDPTLAKGVTKQVEWAAWGSTVSFARTVKRGDEVLSTDTYTSRYQPWQAVYLVGTKTN
ncbi:VanW family protein, partial [candidate division WWE3 bacterium]|nr:VanW family protein [candidate division WWE3 bacterium]